MDWFRSHHGAPTDAKLRLVAKRCGLPTGNVAAIWWALLDCASQAEDRGSIAGFDPAVLAVAYDYPVEQINETLETLRNIGCVSRDNRLVSWERRQPKSGDTSTDRVRRHRLKKKGENVSETDETKLETTKRPRTEQSRTENKSARGARDDVSILGKTKRRLTDEERDLASRFNHGNIPAETTDAEVALWRERAQRKQAAKVVPLPTVAEPTPSTPSPAPAGAAAATTETPSVSAPPPPAVTPDPITPGAAEPAALSAIDPAWSGLDIPEHLRRHCCRLN